MEEEESHTGETPRHRLNPGAELKDRCVSMALYSTGYIFVLLKKYCAQFFMYIAHYAYICIYYYYFF